MQHVLIGHGRGSGLSILTISLSAEELMNHVLIGCRRSSFCILPVAHKCLAHSRVLWYANT